MDHDKLIAQALIEWKNDETLKNLPFDKLMDLIIHRIQTFEYVKDLKYKQALQIMEGQIECETCKVCGNRIKIKNENCEKCHN